MQVFIFHLMPYTHMDLNYESKWRSSWVVMPNTEYDPEKAMCCTTAISMNSNSPPNSASTVSR